ncbi:hypothetical protein ABR737_01340 [Streptomyces sp. Edi2]|uniref:hypothetical protein n=1 Tax=Streptomyces sp. Edi2 TaxID=3162528 RepID=UPI003305728A
MTATLADAQAATAQTLAVMTEPQIDALNAAVAAEVDRIDTALDRARDRLYGSLCLSKVSEPYGRGYRQVWPITHDEAEQRARQHLTDGTEPDMRTKLMAGVAASGAYAAGLVGALDAIESLRDETRTLLQGAGATLAAEWDRRGGWSRMFLCLSNGGHIHASRSCKSLRWDTPVAWLPKLSGMEWRDGYRTFAEQASGSSEAVMCSMCFPEAPVEWTQPAPVAPEAVCGASGLDGWNLLDDRQKRRSRAFVDCPGCGKKEMALTSTWKIRKHKPVPKG